MGKIEVVILRCFAGRSNKAAKRPKESKSSKTRKQHISVVPEDDDVPLWTGAMFDGSAESPPRKGTKSKDSGTQKSLSTKDPDLKLRGGAGSSKVQWSDPPSPVLSWRSNNSRVRQHDFPLVVGVGMKSPDSQRKSTGSYTPDDNAWKSETKQPASSANDVATPWGASRAWNWNLPESRQAGWQNPSGRENESWGTPSPIPSPKPQHDGKGNTGSAANMGWTDPSSDNSKEDNTATSGWDDGKQSNGWGMEGQASNDWSTAYWGGQDDNANQIERGSPVIDRHDASNGTHNATASSDDDVPAGPGSYPKPVFIMSQKPRSSRVSANEGIIRTRTKPEGWVPGAWSPPMVQKSRKSKRKASEPGWPQDARGPRFIEPIRPTHTGPAYDGNDYIHKKSNPRHMDTHQNPYAVFVFHYRDDAAGDQTSDLTSSECGEDERRRLLKLDKSELVEELLRAKIQASETADSDKSTFKTDAHEAAYQPNLWAVNEKLEPFADSTLHEDNADRGSDKDERNNDVAAPGSEGRNQWNSPDNNADGAWPSTEDQQDSQDNVPWATSPENRDQPQDAWGSGGKEDAGWSDNEQKVPGGWGGSASGDDGNRGWGSNKSSSHREDKYAWGKKPGSAGGSSGGGRGRGDGW